MPQFTAKTTRRNQVTIPNAVRRVLGINPGDSVTFTVEDGGQVRLSVPAFTLDTAFGSVKPVSGTQNLDEIIRIAKEEQAERTVQELTQD